MAIKKIQQVLQDLDNSDDDVDNQENILQQWAESIVDECARKAGRDVAQYVEQVKEQL